MTDITQEMLNKILTGGFGADGWAGLQEGNDEQTAMMTYEQQLKNFQNAKTLVDGINGDALAILHDITMIPVAFDVEGLGLINACGYGIFREGQKSIYHFIERAREIVAAGPPEPPENLTENNEES